MLVPVSQLGSGPKFYLIFSIKKGRRGQFFNWHKPSRFPFHFIKKYNCPLTSNRVSYIIRSFHIVEPAGFSTFPQHPCGKPEDGRAMRPKRSLACAWALLIPHTYYKRTRCICQACVETNIKPDVYCLRAPMHIYCGPMHISFAAACGHRCILPADRMYMACGGDAHIPRSTSWPSERHRSTSQRIVRISEFYVDFCSVLW